MHAAGLRPGDRVVHCLNYCLWTGGVTDHLILEAAGATVIPFGAGATRQLIDAILELKATAIHCTPS
jgi:phenylacetate-CoA ligase